MDLLGQNEVTPVVPVAELSFEDEHGDGFQGRAKPQVEGNVILSRSYSFTQHFIQR